MSLWFQRTKRYQIKSYKFKLAREENEPNNLYINILFPHGRRQAKLRH